MYEKRTESEIKAIESQIANTCYTTSSGPWRKSWIRYGYDPRKTRDSARYQVLEVRYYPEGKKRPLPQIDSAAVDNSSKKARIVSQSRRLAQSSCGSWKSEDSMSSKEFMGRTIDGSLASQLFQLHELEQDPECNAVLLQHPLNDTYNAQCGWHSEETLLMLRKILRIRLEELFGKMDTSISSSAKESTTVIL